LRRSSSPVLPNLPGFLAQVSLVPSAGVPPFFLELYHYAWFAGFGIAFGVYLALRRIFPLGVRPRRQDRL